MADPTTDELALVSLFRDELKEFGLKQAVERLDVPQRGIVRQLVRQALKEYLLRLSYGGEMRT